MGRTSRLRAAALAALTSLGVFAMVATAPPPAAAASTLADRVIADAIGHLNAPYVWGTSGPRTFDCSGLVYRVFLDNGLGAIIDFSRSAYTDYAIFLARGLASRTDGRPGDLVIYNGGSHVGIYLGGGRVISALATGVRITSLDALTIPFTAFLHTGLDGTGLALSATPARSARAIATTATRYTTAAANLRSAPGTTARRLQVLGRGTRLKVLAVSHDRIGRRWYEVRTPSRIVGWVAGWLTR